jgi:hypothetical protein
MAATARTAARKGLHHARAWTAPRLERTGHTLEDRVAPTMAAMLSAAARRIEPPAPPRRRRRWPLVAAGLITAAGLSATAAYLLNRRGAARPAHTSQDDGMTSTPSDAGDQIGGDVNGCVRTP